MEDNKKMYKDRVTIYEVAKVQTVKPGRPEVRAHAVAVPVRLETLPLLFTRVFSPPESSANSRRRMSSSMERPLATLLTAVSVSQPPSPSKRAFRSP